MAGRRAWWLIPVAIAVLVAVVRIDRATSSRAAAERGVVDAVSVDAVDGHVAAPRPGSTAELRTQPIDAVARGREPKPGLTPQRVQLRDRTGRDLGTMSVDQLRAGLATELMVVLPETAANQRLLFTLERYPEAADATEPAPFLQGRPFVRESATMPIRGLPAGLYRLEIVYRDATGTRRLSRDRVPAPGRLDLRRSANAAPPR